MSALALQALADETGGQLIGESIPLRNLVIDSRRVCEGDLFAALKGHLNDSTADLPVMDALSHQERLALDLAQAEVRLRSVLHTIDEFEQEHDPLFEERANQEHDYQLYLRFVRNRSLDKWTRDASKILLQIITKDIRKGQRQIANRACLLQRYKREALSKQRKAQKAWCDQFKRD